MIFKDYYRILELDTYKVSEDDIKSAYRKLAKLYHPDLHPGDKQAEAKFKEINEAYSILSNEELRSKYDKYGTIDNVQNDNFSGFNGMEDIINHIRNMHGFGDFGFGCPRYFGFRRSDSLRFDYSNDFHLLLMDYLHFEL